ncbi:STAS domain-containing protein [Arsenicicoccus dermatophilus]|uniref:STAS domain-containing protein n=1 Tax=Arsenicicoccus dermatophilus TaxID=1076331 RepID=UPI003916F527
MTAQLIPTAIRAGQVVLRATGELDIVEAPRLARALDALVAAGACRLVLDLTDLELVDSAVINVLVSRLRALRARGGDLVVAAGAERIVRPFTATRTDEVLAIVSTVADAQDVAELRARRVAHGTPRPARRRAS